MYLHNVLSSSSLSQKSDLETYGEVVKGFSIFFLMGFDAAKVLLFLRYTKKVVIFCLFL